jgi:catechol 2,3-dioxygenase-like lactoylglutathione lyase family enzyme
MNAPFRIKGLDHVVLRATDISAMKRFYCDILGCILERAQPDLGLYQLRAGQSLIDLVDMQGQLGRAGGKPPGIEGRNMDHFCIGIDPFQECELRAHLKAHGIAVGEVADRYGAEGGGPSLYIKDPEDNVLELKGPPS